MNRQDLEIHDFDHLKSKVKKQGQAWLKAMMKSRWAYKNEYKDRIDEFYRYQKEYWRLFHLNRDNPGLQKLILDSLQITSANLTQLYDILPEIAAGPVSNNDEEFVSKITEAPAREIKSIQKI